MAICDACGEKIISGGSRVGDLIYCNEFCMHASAMVCFGEDVADEDAELLAYELHAGRCPVCNGEGPCDVTVAHRVWSVVVAMKWEVVPHLCCGPCGTRLSLKSLATTALCGWWSTDGLFRTPVALFQNLRELRRKPHPLTPSPRVHGEARLRLAIKLLEEDQLSRQPETRHCLKDLPRSQRKPH